MMKKQVVLLSLLLLLMHGVKAGVVETDLLQQRHNVPPTDKRAVFNFPIVTTSSTGDATSTTTHFLSSSHNNDNEVCAPELDGYFGGGTGRPPMAQLHVVQADRMDIFDTLLVTTFPSICDHDNDDADNADDHTKRSLVRPLQGRVSGYHFGATEQWCTNSTTTPTTTTTQQQQQQEATPATAPAACTTVTTVSLYGHDITWDDCVTLLDTLTQYIPSAHRYASRIEHVSGQRSASSTTVHTVLVVWTVLFVTIALAVVWRWSSSSGGGASSNSTTKNNKNGDDDDDDPTVRTHVTSVYLQDEEESLTTEQSSARHTHQQSYYSASYHRKDEQFRMPSASSMRRESRGW